GRGTDPQAGLRPGPSHQFPRGPAARGLRHSRERAPDLHQVYEFDYRRALVLWLRAHLLGARIRQNQTGSEPRRSAALRALAWLSLGGEALRALRAAAAGDPWRGRLYRMALLSQRAQDREHCRALGRFRRELDEVAQLRLSASEIVGLLEREARLIMGVGEVRLHLAGAREGFGCRVLIAGPLQRQ